MVIIISGADRSYVFAVAKTSEVWAGGNFNSTELKLSKAQDVKFLYVKIHHYFVLQLSYGYK